MELYLMQHGHALSEEEDPLRPLSAEGIVQLKASAAAMKKMGMAPELIVCSPKKRSRQTAALLSEILNYPYSDIVESEMLLPQAEPQQLVELLGRYLDRRSVLLVGHLPSLGRIASALLGDGAKIPVRFENGGLCRIDLAEVVPGKGELHCCITAGQMRLIA